MSAQLFALSKIKSVRDKCTLDHLLLVDQCGRLLVALLLFLTPMILVCTPAHAQTPGAGISANPTSISAGGSSTLTWHTVNCTTANLNGTPVALNGSEVVSPTTTTTYRITCSNSAGQTDWGQVTVSVGSSGGPPGAGISANPTSIAAGGSSTLTWNTVNCTTANLNGTPVALNGSEVVSPTTTTTYRITCANTAGQTDWGQVTVTVNAPTATITANPGLIAPGGSSTLTWSSTNATSATLNGATVAVNGSEVVSPTATTTYTFVAKGSTGATATSSVTVSVTSGSAGTKGQWAPIQTWPWMAAHAHLLPTGKVLFWPSFANGNNPTLWDPVANTFANAPMAAYNIFCSGHSLLPDGRLLVTGGHNGSSGYGYPYASIYNASQNTWTQIPNMQDARWYPTNTTLANGDVLVVSGEITPGTYSALPQIWHPATNSWLNLTSAQLVQPLYPMMFLAPNGQVFNAGPNQASRYLNTSGTGSWTVVGNLNYSGTRDYGSSVIYDGKILIAGGDGSGSGSATNTAEVIDLNASSPKWSYTGSLAYARRQLNLTLLPDGKVLASGGSGGYGFDNQNYPVYAAEMWDPATGQWTTMDSITVYRGYHSTALLLPDGRVVSAGGEQTGASGEIYSPPYLFKGARPSISSGPSSVKYAQQFFVGTPDATSISQVTWIGLGSVTHAQNQNQRLVHLQFTQASGGLNITAPANGNLAPPGYYMLFLVNSNGVPSVAKIIQITN
ncbi:MAG TPA: galactose oxidase-like domain-containing protein [Acidobacteriaceae bacterium]